MPIDLTGKTAEEIAEIAKSATRVEAPTYYAAQFVISVGPNDAMIQLQRPQPAVMPPFGEPAPFALVETVATLHVSLGTLKDLGVAITDQISQYEKALGRKVETEYSKSMTQK